MDTGIELLLLLRVLIETLLQLGRLAAFATAVDEIRSREAVVLALPSPLVEAALVPHQIFLLSLVELRRRVRAHRNLRPTKLRGETTTTNIARATNGRPIPIESLSISRKLNLPHATDTD